MEPKSIHTYLESPQVEIYNYDVDIRVTVFPPTPDRSWLYYFSLQVDFTDFNEWSHGGFQWSGTAEFANNENRGVNWGGGSDWAGYGGIGVTNTPFTWELNKWYRYRVWRVDKDADGFQRWLFAVLDYETDKEHQFGTVRTKSVWIKSAVVFTETGYGVQCHTPRTRVEWRCPTFRTPHGEFVPKIGIANYNGTCADPCNTNQGLISHQPLLWFHSTNSPRHVRADTPLWQF